ncbi:MAG: hypothetical protein AAGL69_03130 [Pseudomonadota bacterium]
MSEQSTAQFQTMLTHLVTLTSNALADAEELPPMALTLNQDDEVNSIVGASGEREELRTILKAIQKTLAAQAEQGEIVACCMSYPDFADQCIVAFMENRQNECTELRIPVVVTGKSLSLDLENLSVADGSVFVFPVLDD